MAGEGPDYGVGVGRGMISSPYNRKQDKSAHITKSVSYVATGSNSNQVISLTGTESDTATVYELPKSMNITNTGSVPITAIIGYEGYSNENTDEGPRYLHCFLLPGESISPPIRATIPTENVLEALDGEVVDFTPPNVAVKVDTQDATASGELANTDDPVTFEVDNGHEKYFVGDYIRVEDEILRVEATNSDNPIKDLSGNTLPTLSDNHISCSRGHFGSTNASHSGAAGIFWPLFNEHYDWDKKLSGDTQLVQTDALGRYKSCNFFGYGRPTGDLGSSSKPLGLVPGSIVMRWYSKAYQDVLFGGPGTAGNLGVSNLPITSSTNSKLSASTEYSLNLIIDDSSETTVSFTTDSSNLTFGGNTGIVAKIQDAINTATRTPGNNLFGYSCTVSIVNGALRFTSNSRLLPHNATNGSKMEIKDGAGGTNVFTGALGIFPDITGINAPVKPKLPQLHVRDSLTYSSSFNFDRQRICHDDGKGNIVGCANGTINYETGAIDIFGAPKNASFEVSCIHDNPFSGKLDANKEYSNSISGVYANVLNKNVKGQISIRMVGR